MRKIYSQNIMQRLFTFLLLIVVLLVGSTASIKAEGLKELVNGTSNEVTTNFGKNSWASAGAATNQRLNIYIKNPTNEVVYLGFSTSGDTYKIYDPNGNEVFSEVTNSNGSDFGQVEAGPAPALNSGGYTPQIYTPAAGAPSGNYYIEFPDRANAIYWDITVATVGSPATAQKGRVWSMIWWFDMGGWNTVDSFEATLYAYSTDGFVSKVDYKGSDFRPYVFSVYYNDKGPGTSGDLEQDRKSVEGSNSGVPSFPVFLNPPPQEIMPSAEFGDFASVPTISRTAVSGANKFSFNVESTQAGSYNILLNIENPTDGGVFDNITNTKDRVLAYDVIPQPGETAPYVRAIPWDGKDGNGSNVNLDDGDNLNFTVSYTDGGSNFPTYDAEYLTGGLSVSQVRPSNGYVVELYWDDSDISDATGDGSSKRELNGGAVPAHTWTNNSYGDVNTINTWWYCNVVSGGSKTLPLPGLSASAPTVQATNIRFSEVGQSAMKIKWTDGNGSQRVVFVKEANSGSALPTDNTSYTANTIFKSGSQIGSTGWYCVYNGASSSSVVVTGLTEDTEYQVMVCEYNVGGTGEIYNTDTATDNPMNQRTATVIQASEISFSNVVANSMTVNWANGTGTRRLAFIKPTLTGTPTPVNNTTYTANSSYGLGDPIGTTGWYCIYNGTGTTVDVSNLASNTDYKVMVLEYFGSNGNENYVTITNTNNPNTTKTSNLSPAHHIVFSNVGTTDMDIAWTDGDGTARQVFVKETSSTTDLPIPVDGVSYSSNATFESGDQIGSTGWYCVYEGSGSSVSIDGLDPSTEYRVMVADYVNDHEYIDGTVATNPLNQATLGVKPDVQATNILFSDVTSSEMKLDWTDGNGVKRVVFAKQTTSGQPLADDGTTYTANLGFELGDQIGSTGWYCIYNGNGSSVVVNNLLADTDYRFMVCEYNYSASGELYLTSVATLNPQNKKTLVANIYTPVITAVDKTINEGITFVETVSATDEDSGDTKLFSISGTDALLFNIDPSTGDLSFKLGPDYEIPGDNGGDNDYNLTVTVTDAVGHFDSEDIKVTVVGINDNAPVITNHSSDASAAINYAENGTADVIDWNATDADGET
ncbi:MAG: hypothetical protein JEZ01_19400, partial [Labilibaculum sp.]